MFINCEPPNSNCLGGCDLRSNFHSRSGLIQASSFSFKLSSSILTSKSQTIDSLSRSNGDCSHGSSWYRQSQRLSHRQSFSRQYQRAQATTEELEVLAGIDVDNFVEKIVDHKERDRSFNNWKFRVRWTGYEPDEDSIGMRSKTWLAFDTYSQEHPELKLGWILCKKPLGKGHIRGRESYFSQVGGLWIHSRKTRFWSLNGVQNLNVQNLGVSKFWLMS